MIKTIRDNINPAYSLHDMNVIAFEVEENNIIMKTQSGMIKHDSELYADRWVCGVS